MKDLTLFSFCCLCLLTVTFADDIYKNCGQKTSGQVKKVAVSGCTKIPCTLQEGRNVTFTVEFIASKAIKTLKADVHGVIAGVPIPFTPPNTDGCKDSGITCPVKASSDVTYHNIIPVLKQYPKIQLTVKYELKDEDNADVFCVVVPCQIK